MQLLRTILIIIIVYYAVKLFFRYVVPLVIRYFFRKASEKQYGRKETGGKKEGEMHIRYKPNKKDLPDDLGEFVDYEEIKDKDSKKNNDT